MQPIIWQLAPEARAWLALAWVVCLGAGDGGWDRDSGDLCGAVLLGVCGTDKTSHKTA